ncbi:hypothetical protein AYK26_05605 [Euryarchaeota archaeon SM23-78]|nr:MAG: hypothetical protein AYK26_05605 [Euryarchaeota archaeon SM23-78]
MEKNKVKIICEKIIKKIRPEKQEFIEVDNIIKKINTILKKNRIKAEGVAGGSYAKGTILKNDFDIDLFVRFALSYKKNDISKMLGQVLKPLKVELVHGSRDYYQLRKNNLLFEIVPVLKINNYKQVFNVTDMSPLHVDYVKKHLVKKPLLGDEIRLAKQFCKAARVYGAESYIQGFSGHVLDLLIIYYGGFENLLMQASVWGSRVIIDPENHLRDPLSELNKSKIQSPLIIVDPVQPDRNAAAAVSKEKFEVFKEKAKQLLNKPSEKFFEIKKLSINELKDKAKNNWLIIAKAKPLKGKDDIVGTKIMKCFEHIEKHLKKNDFTVLEAGWEFDIKESIIYYIINKEKLSDKIVLKGPPVKVKINAKMFKSKHKNVFEKKERLYAEEKREYKTPEKLVKDLIKKDYIKERVAKILIKEK